MTVYAPRALVIVSHWPFFDLFKRSLLEFYAVASSIDASPQAVASSVPFWRLVKHFLEEVPVPPEGTTAIKFHIGQASLCFGRSNPSDYPCIQTAVAPLLASFPAKVAVQLLVAVASEHRVLLVSSHMHLLTLVAESLRVLLFPFKFCHTYIPVLPSSMLSFIHRASCFFVCLPMCLLALFDTFPIRCRSPVSRRDAALHPRYSSGRRAARVHSQNCRCCLHRQSLSGES